MTLLVVYARIYGQSLLQALGAIGKNAWTLALPMGLVVAFYFLGLLLGPLGLVGGFLLAMARAAGFSVYAFVLAGVVGKQRVSLGDLRGSIGPYFWNWVNLFFVLWVIDFVVAAALGRSPQGPTLLVVLNFMELVVLNAAPETIYQRGTHGGLETIQRSVHFLQENWIEWFVPNGLVLAALWFAVYGGGFTLLSAVPFGLVGSLLLAGATFHVVMVFRGFLYQVLDGSTHRQRMFRYRGTLG